MPNIELIEFYILGNLGMGVGMVLDFIICIFNSCFSLGYFTANFPTLHDKGQLLVTCNNKGGNFNNI